MPVPYPRAIVLASAGSETELYPPPTPRRRPRSSTPRGRHCSPLLSRARIGPVSSRTRSATAHGQGVFYLNKVYQMMLFLYFPPACSL